MCRPSCCDNSGGQGAGIAGVAIIVGAAFIVAKIGPIVAQIAHVALEVIRIAALTTGLVLALAIITWAAITVTRWQLRRPAPAASQTHMVAAPASRIPLSQASRPA